MADLSLPQLVTGLAGTISVESPLFNSAIPAFLFLFWRDNYFSVWLFTEIPDFPLLPEQLGLGDFWQPLTRCEV